MDFNFSTPPILRTGSMLPSDPVTVDNAQPGTSWLDFIKTSLGYSVDPFGAITYSATSLGNAASKVGDAGAAAVGSAAAGVQSGIRTTVVVIGLGIAFYVLLLILPFLPRPAASR